MKPKKVAIVADWLTSRGGAEHVVLALVEAFSDTHVEVFTSVYNSDLFPEFSAYTVKTTFLQKLPSILRNKHQFLLPLFPCAFQRLDLSEFDLIVSSASSGFSKCVRKTRDDQKHVCYCHTPVRFLYHAREEYIETYPLPWYAKPVKFILPWLLDRLTRVDLSAARDIDFFISNSNFVGQRIKKYYHQDSLTIYPGINTQPFVDAGSQYEKKDYFFAVGRFIPYKKFDLLIETFIHNGLPLKLGGLGPEYERCKKLAQGHSNIEFLGFVDYDKLPQLYAEARAFLFPAEEDFGLTPVEALSAGTPVLYYDIGGATESVGVGPFGVSFHAQTVQSLQEAINQFVFQESTFKKHLLVDRGKQFDQKILKQKIREFIQKI